MRNQERPENQQIESGASSERRAFKWVRWLGAGMASIALAVGLAACGSDSAGNDGRAPAVQQVGSGGTESGLGEESGSWLALTDTFDQVRAGARLFMTYDPATNAFVGAVENVTTDVLDRVRVEVHLSNGVELGPTTPLDLAPGEIVDVRLPATATPFDGWSPHAEVGSGGAEGSGEHGPGGEGSEASEGSQGSGAMEGSGEHRATAAVEKAPTGGAEGSGEHGSGGEGSEGSGAGEGSEVSENGLGEESGNRLALTDVFDEVRAGARLVMAYDPALNTFVGAVENVTADVLDRVRVEVHLSNGVELGPTNPVNLGPGEIAHVLLPATTTPFDGWSPHAEVGPSGAEGSGEHGPGGEGSEGGEGRERSGGHGSEGSGS